MKVLKLIKKKKSDDDKTKLSQASKIMYVGQEKKSSLLCTYPY